MKQREFLAAVQSRTARVAISASALRGRGNKGAVEKARAFMRELKLQRFGKDPARFRRELDRATRSLLTRLPRGARHWGIARKLLNIFLRDCLYTRYLDSAYKLSRAEAALEVPLDSVTALCLKRAAGRGKLPRWPGVKHLTPALSKVFQDAAASKAMESGRARVHLDALWWSQSRD